MSIVASIYGRAARDGELRTSASGKPWCRVSIAVEAGTDRTSGEAHTLWLSLVAFSKQAEELARVRKGETVSAIGRVEVNKWTGQDGVEHEDLQLICDAIVSARSSRPGGKPKANADRQYSASHRVQAPSGVPFDDPIRF